MKSFQPDQLDIYWENLVLALIGETIDDADEVCGCRVVDKSTKKGTRVWQMTCSETISCRQSYPFAPILFAESLTSWLCSTSGQSPFDLDFNLFFLFSLLQVRTELCSSLNCGSGHVRQKWETSWGSNCWMLLRTTRHPSQTAKWSYPNLITREGIQSEVSLYSPFSADGPWTLDSGPDGSALSTECFSVFYPSISFNPDMTQYW